MTVVVRRNETLLNYTFAVIERPATPAVTTPHSESLHDPAVGSRLTTISPAWESRPALRTSCPPQDLGAGVK